MSVETIGQEATERYDEQEETLADIDFDNTDFSPEDATEYYRSNEQSDTGDAVRIYLNGIGKAALLNAEQEVELAKRIEAGLYAQKLLDKYDGDHVEKLEDRELPLLTDTKQRDLGRVARQGVAAKNRMLEANLRLVVSQAKRYQGRGLELNDLIQEGNLGLIRAVEKFDYTLGYKFSTYATGWIRQSIARGLADTTRTIRLPIHMVEQVNKLGRVRDDMERALGREATDEELAVELGDETTSDRVAQLTVHSRRTLSLDSPVGEETDDTLMNFIEIEDPSVDDLVEFMHFQDEIRKFLTSVLTEREQEVIEKRFGLHDNRIWTLAEIAAQLSRVGHGYDHMPKSVSRERVRQIERKAMEKLHDAFTGGDSLQDFLQQ